MRVNLKDRNAHRVPRIVLYAGVLLLVLLLKVGVGQVSPGAQIAVGLGLHWAFGLAWLGFALVFWTLPGQIRDLPARGVLVVVTTWFPGRAILETHAALT